MDGQARALCQALENDSEVNEDDFNEVKIQAGV